MSIYRLIQYLLESLSGRETIGCVEQEKTEETMQSLKYVTKICNLIKSEYKRLHDRVYVQGHWLSWSLSTQTQTHAYTHALRSEGSGLDVSSTDKETRTHPTHTHTDRNFSSSLSLLVVGTETRRQSRSTERDRENSSCMLHGHLSENPSFHRRREIICECNRSWSMRHFTNKDWGPNAAPVTSAMWSADRQPFSQLHSDRPFELGLFAFHYIVVGNAWHTEIIYIASQRKDGFYFLFIYFLSDTRNDNQGNEKAQECMKFHGRSSSRQTVNAWLCSLTVSNLM